MGKALKDHYLRIDARSLGLFRLTFALVLLADLFGRWRYLRDFYSNEGVLPNHNHLFNTRDTGQLWSFLHAFSTPGESLFAFVVILFVYLFFLVGYQTRVFHALALVCLVSLTARNVLLENAGNYAAIALLAFTVFLPLGSRFSIDSLRASLAAREEKSAAALNDRPKVSDEVVQAERRPGWSPTSLAAFAVLVQIAVIYLATALQQRGAWRDGTALYYALNVERWVSPIGASARWLLPGLLSAWTRLLYAAGWAIPALLFVPVAFRWTRWAAIGLMLFHALTLGVLFSFGLYAWSLLAAAALLIPHETWDRLEGMPREHRRRTVIYDADCGICLWLSRLLKRLDLRHHITFQGNDDIAELLVGKPGGQTVRVDLPKAITPELVLGSLVVVDPAGRVFTRSRAVSEVIRALPLGLPVALAMRIPGIAQLLDVLYNVVAARRQRISVAFGMAACGLTPPPEEGKEQGEAEGAPSPEVAPSTRLARRITGALRELAVAVVFAAMLAQTTAANALPVKIPQGKALAAVVTWPRMLARWNVLTPEPPTVDEILVVDGQTRTGSSVDPLTGAEPQAVPGEMQGTELGQLWNDYLFRLHEKEWSEFQRAFRDYLSKGGPMHDASNDKQIAGYDVYWIKQPIPPPGAARTEEPTREKMFTYSRGGRLGLERALPALRPDPKRQ